MPRLLSPVLLIAAVLIAVFLLSTGARPAFAQTDQPLPTIGVSADTADPVGMEMQAQLRDAIKRAGFYPSTHAEAPLVGIHLISVAPKSVTDGQFAVYSAAWTTRDGRFLTHTVGTCTLRGAAECANALMVTTSQMAQMQQTREAARR